jgi:hypothetical protein
MRYRTTQRDILSALAEDKIPWMWDCDLPQRYSSMVIVGSACFTKRRPVILRGSRYAMAHRWTPGDRWSNFVDRAARRFKVTALWLDGRGRKQLDAIQRRAHELYPSARPRGRNFYLDGEAVYPMFLEPEQKIALEDADETIAILDKVIYENSDSSGTRKHGNQRCQQRPGDG